MFHRTPRPSFSGLSRVSRMARAACVVGVCASSGVGVSACGGPDVELVLVRADDLLAPPPFVRLEFGFDDGGDPVTFDPRPPDSVAVDFADVPPGTPFYVDVIGCTDSDVESCATPDTFVARGCSAFLELARGETRTIEVTVHGAVQGNALCPPAR